MLSVKVTGAADWARDLERFGKALPRKDVEEDLLVAVRPLIEAAVGNIPIGPPAIHLKENIGAEPDETSTAPAVRVGAFNVPKLGRIFYDIFLEFGTVKQNATPWLTPARDSTAGQVMQTLARLVVDRVRRAAKG